MEMLRKFVIQYVILQQNVKNNEAEHPTGHNNYHRWYMQFSQTSLKSLNGGERESFLGVAQCMMWESFRITL